MRISVLVLTAVLVVALVPGAARAQSLRGSPASLDIQNRMAKEHDFTYLGTAAQLEKFVRAGYLVPVRPGADFVLHEVSFPYARPEAELFVTRLAAQYRSACGEALVVTSLTRPASLQPRNASDRSVHPTGMAVDLRVPRSAACRRWLERVLLDLEERRLVEATRERAPAHYHVAIFPEPYRRWVEERGATVRVAARSASKPASTSAAKAPPAGADKTAARYRVRPGDSLWKIAREHGTTVPVLRAKNALATTRIRPGQVLEVPVSH